MSRLVATNRLPAANRLTAGVRAATTNTQLSTLKNRYIVNDAGVAGFEVDLKPSLNPRFGFGKPIFTRDTTAVAVGSEGFVKIVKAGEARVEKARRVENLVPNFNVSWISSSGGTGTNGVISSGFTDPFNGNGAYRITANRGAGTAGADFSRAEYAIVTSNTKSYRVSVWLKSNTGSNQKVLLRHNSILAQNEVTVTTSWQRMCIPAYTGSNGSGDITIGNRAALGNTNIDILVYGYQLEDVTLQSNKTPAEHVSRGVLSSAPYHGTGVDGVKCFTTYNGNTVIGNVVLEAIGAPIPDATLYSYVAEGPRTNLLLHSVDFINAVWTDYDVGRPATRTANAAIGLDGTATADKLEKAAGFDVRVRQSAVISGAGFFVFSVHIKKDSDVSRFPEVSLRLNTSGTVVERYVMVNTMTGATGIRANEGASNSHAVALSEDGNFWKVQIACLNDTNTSAICTVAPAMGTVLGTANVNASGSAFFERAQLEAGEFASSDIPTTTLSLTRNADVLAYPVTSNLMAEAGSIYFEFIPNHRVSGTVFMFGSYVDANNYTAILHDAINLIFRKRISGTNYDATIALTYVEGVRYKVGATWSSSGTTIYLNGVSGTPHANTTALQLGTTFQIGSDGNSLQHLFGYLRNVKIWKNTLTDTQLINLTK